MPVIYEPSGRALEYSLLALNHYNGCGHGCDYCYARGITARGGRDFDKPCPRPGVIEHLLREAPRLAGTDKRVLLSFLTDPYQQVDVKFKLSRRVIEILRANDIPFQVLTKGGMRAARDFDLYGPHDAFATTLTSISKDDVPDALEPGAASPLDRFSAIIKAHSLGIETWVSLEPVIDPCQSLEVIRVTACAVDLYKVGILNHRTSTTDWRAFGIAAIELLEKLGKKYYIKHDLAKHLEGVPFTSTDTRRVK